MNTAKEDLKEPWRDYLRKKRLKTTQQREAIVDAFLRSKGHVALEDLLTSARKRNPGKHFQGGVARSWVRNTNSSVQDVFIVLSSVLACL